jgi:superkiller protein 3
LYLQNQTDAAIAAYQDALRLNPDLVWGYYNLGQAFAQENRLGEAIAAFRQVVGFHTGLDTLGREVKENIAYSVLGDVLREQGNLSAAATAYRQAIAQYPADGTSYLNLGNVLLAQNQVDEAETAFRSALDRIEDHQIRQIAQAYNGLGKALMQQNNLEMAIAAFQSALVFIPDWSEAQQNLQMAEEQLQRRG